MLQGDDVALADHETADRIRTTSIEELTFERFEIATKSFEHTHRLIEIAFYDLIEEEGSTHIFFFLDSFFIAFVDTTHRRRLVVTEGDEILFGDKYIELVLDISFCVGLILRKVEDEKKVVIIGVDTSILVGLKNCLTIEFVKFVFFDDRIELFERWIDLIQPDSE
jgi:hypothetical protein